MDDKLNLSNLRQYIQNDPRLASMYEFGSQPPSQGFRPNDPVAAYGYYDRSPIVSLLLGSATPRQRVGASFNDLFQGQYGGGLLGILPRK